MGQIQAIQATGEPSYGPISLLVVQATPYCNLDCDYCYLPDRDNRARLKPELLDPILDRLLSSPFIDGDFTLLWHAGEPLALPVSFYDEASRRIQAALERHPERDIAIHQSIQTNGTLIDQQWCECFQRHQISVGVSLDGPAFLHDAHRRTRTGLGSHAATMRGIGWLRRYGLPFWASITPTASSSSSWSRASTTWASTWKKQKASIAPPACREVNAKGASAPSCNASGS
jgi:sulfatase maturation enzyme AslB (radical SAM superfamily)